MMGVSNIEASKMVNTNDSIEEPQVNGNGKKESAKSDSNGTCVPATASIPVENGTKLEENGVKPVESGVKPMENGVKPVENGVKPVENGVKPSENGVKPVENGVKPVAKGVKPVDTVVKPVDNGGDNLKDSDPDYPLDFPLNDEEAFASGLPTPPDGGWGWVVVFASFMIHVIADGITYSFGTFLVEIMNVFDEGRGSASLIPSILVGVTLGVGPIASSLVNRYGCRVVTIVGAILASAGIALSAAAPNVVVLYLTIGIFTGIGFGLIYLPAIVSVSMYFEKKRAFATGIAVCGSGVGTFIMAPVSQGLIDYFGWQGAFLVTAAIVLLSVIFGGLFRPLTNPPPVQSNEEDIENRSSLEKEKEAQSQNPIIKNNSNSFQRGQIEFAPEIKLNGEAMRPHETKTSEIKGKIPRVALSHPVLSSQPEQKKPFLAYGSHSRIYEQHVNNVNATNSHQHHLVHPNSGVMFRKDIFYGGSLYNIPEYKSNPRRYSRQIIAIQEAEISRMASYAVLEVEEGALKDTPTKICGCIPVSVEVATAFSEMMDLSLLKDLIFILFAISNFLTSIGFNVPYVYTVDRAILIGIDKDDASFLLSIVGIANTIGRIVLGFLSDRQWINRLYLYNMSLAICGIAMCLSNLCNDYTTQAVFCAVFGITSGAYVGLTSVVLVDLLGLDKLTNAFGLLLLFQGIASVMGPPIIGSLYDAIGNYESGFYFSGTMIFISGVMLFILPWVQKNRPRDFNFGRQVNGQGGGHGHWKPSQDKSLSKKKPRKYDPAFFPDGIDEEDDETEGQFTMRI